MDRYSQERLLEIGELVLSEMGASKSGALTVGSYIQQVRGEAEDDLYSKDVKALLEREGLIEAYKSVGGRSVITPLGMAVYRSGGLQQLLEERRREAEVELNLKTSTIVANEQTTVWMKLSLKTWWMPYLISLVSLGVAVLALWRTWDR